MNYHLPLALAAALLLAWRVGALRSAGTRVAGWLESRWAPLVIAVLTAIIVTVGWGSWRQIPIIHDEASYLFQAKLFASGRWTAPSPPLPEFFEQWHVFVVPHYASKYPPGHALLLVPGIWLGLPGMIPVLLGAMTAALVFSIVRRLTNGVIAFWTWGCWVTSFIVLWMLGSYFSQTTSAFCWMLGWYALLRWREGSERWLFVVAIVVAWLGLTRPLTALAYAIPVGIYVLRRTARQRHWRTLGSAIAVGLALLMLLPFWSMKTIGTVRTTPYALYSKVYFPWDAPGFGLDSTPPLRAITPDMALVAASNAEPHRAYVPSALPKNFIARTRYVLAIMWGPPRLIVAALGVIGLFAMSAELAFGLASMFTLLVCYLWFNHDPTWPVYYFEIEPVLALLAALGLWRVMNWRWRDLHDRTARQPAAPLAAGASLVMMVAFAVYAWSVASAEHRDSAHAQSYQSNFLRAVAQLPKEKTIVFVRYASWHNPHLSLIHNDPDLAHALRWYVYDRGADNVRLTQAAPDRKAYLFDEQRSTLNPLVAPHDTAAAPDAPRSGRGE